MRCRKLSSASGLFPFSASITPIPRVMRIKNVPRHYQVSPEGQRCPWLRSTEFDDPCRNVALNSFSSSLSKTLLPALMFLFYTLSSSKTSSLSIFSNTLLIDLHFFSFQLIPFGIPTQTTLPEPVIQESFPLFLCPLTRFRAMVCHYNNSLICILNSFICFFICHIYLANLSWLKPPLISFSPAPGQPDTQSCQLVSLEIP